MNKLGFYGFGKMAEAIWNGVSDSGILNASQIQFYRRNPEEVARIQDSHNIQYASPQSLIENCDVIFLCVKPQGIRDVLEDIKQQHEPSVLATACWVSIIAGTPIQTFQDYLGSNTPVVRVMPNTPSLLKDGMAGISWSDTVTDEQKELVRAVFGSVGQIIECDEPLQHVVTGISGSGPAFFYELAKHVTQLGTEKGLSEDDALLLISQTLIGAGKMLRETGRTPQALIDQVVSPGGTTQAGLNTLEEQQMGSTLQAVVQSAIDRSIELGQGG